MDTCLICGGYVPEGRQVCINCEIRGPKELMEINKDYILKFTIPLNPITKKNSMRIITNRRTGRPMIIQSEAYIQYEKDCQYFMKKLDKPINKPINIRAIYYMGTRRKVDITNLHSALHDILTVYNVIEDDNSRIVKSTDGSRVKYDKDNPRTEIYITEVS